MPRSHNTNRSGGPFSEATIEAVWRKANTPYTLDTLRTDCCGALMKRSLYGTTEDWGWEIDHIMPVALGGGDELSNLQPLQWKNNRRKSDSLPNDWTCAVTS